MAAERTVPPSRTDVIAKYGSMLAPARHWEEAQQSARSLPYGRFLSGGNDSWQAAARCFQPMSSNSRSYPVILGPSSPAAASAAVRSDAYQPFPDSVLELVLVEDARFPLV
jgi:hypothetical protein